MTINGLSVGLNLPEALHSKGEGEEELTHGLPPYRPRRAYLVDEYPACPDSWLRSSGRIKSYFVPIMADTGLWLDFKRPEAIPIHKQRHLRQGRGPVECRGYLRDLLADFLQLFVALAWLTVQE